MLKNLLPFIHSNVGKLEKENYEKLITIVESEILYNLITNYKLL